MVSTSLLLRGKGPRFKSICSRRVLKYFVFSHRNLGKIPILTDIFQRGCKPPTRIPYDSRFRRRYCVFVCLFLQFLSCEKAASLHTLEDLWVNTGYVNTHMWHVFDSRMWRFFTVAPSKIPHAHCIHGTGICTYTITININHPKIGKYTVRLMDPSWASIPEILRFVRAYLNPEAARKHAAGQLVPLLRFYSSGEQWTKTHGTLGIIEDYTALNRVYDINYRNPGSKQPVFQWKVSSWFFL